MDQYDMRLRFSEAELEALSEILHWAGGRNCNHVELDYLIEKIDGRG